jgi:aspartokinase
MKFGGTSVGSVDALTKATQIIKEARAQYPRLAVITSAMSGVTDLLLKSATLAAQGISIPAGTEATLKKSTFRSQIHSSRMKTAYDTKGRSVV